MSKDRLPDDQTPQAPAEGTEQLPGQLPGEGRFAYIERVFGITKEELTRPTELFQTEKGQRFLEAPLGKSFAEKFAPDILRRHIAQLMANLKPGDTLPRKYLDFLDEGGTPVEPGTTGEGPQLVVKGAREVVQRNIALGNGQFVRSWEIHPEPGTTELNISSTGPKAPDGTEEGGGEEGGK